MPKSKVKLVICGVSCTLITDESEAYMESLAAEVEGVMDNFMRATGSMNKDLAAVTTALSFCDEAKKLRETAPVAQGPDLSPQLRELEKKLAASQKELANTQKKLAALDGAQAELQKKLAQAEEALHRETETEKSPVTQPVITKEQKLKNPLRAAEEFEQQGLVSFFEKK